MSNSIVVGARFIITRPGEILSPGQVVISDGIIREVNGSLLHRNDIDLHDAAILPALVNPHTHLEFSEFENPLDAGANFPQWIGTVVAHRRKLEEAFATEAELASYRQLVYRKGYEESYRFGVQTLADIVTPPWEPSWLANETRNEQSHQRIESEEGVQDHPRLRVLPMPELLGLHDGQFRQSAQWCENAIAGAERLLTEGDTNCLHPAISPHSPYSTIAGLLQTELKRFSVNKVAMHLAESREELEWLSEATGPFRDAFERIGVPTDQPRLSVEECIALLGSYQNALLVHGNYLSTSQLEMVAAASNRLTMVYCPRTHEHFSHASYPLEHARKLGIRVVLGTDSRASSPDLNLWADLVLATRKHSIRPADSLAMVTVWAAEALGVEGQCGVIAEGLRPAMNYAPIPQSVGSEEVLEYLTHEVGAVRPVQFP